MLCIPGPHPSAHGLLRHERTLIGAGNRLADHQAFRLCAPLQTLNGPLGQPCSRTVLPTSLFLKPVLEFRVETHGEPAAAAHDDHLFQRNASSAYVGHSTTKALRFPDSPFRPQWLDTLVSTYGAASRDSPCGANFSSCDIVCPIHSGGVIFEGLVSFRLQSLIHPERAAVQGRLETPDDRW